MNGRRDADGRSRVVSTNQTLIPVSLDSIEHGLSFLAPECRDPSTFEGCTRTLFRDLDDDGSFEELIVDPATGALVLDDNCPSVPNPDQRDANHNGVGDACENLVTGSQCGDGLVEDVEPCDGAATAACPDGCEECHCRCLAATSGKGIAAGKKRRLKARFVVPLSEYGGGSVSVAIEADGAEARSQQLGSLAAAGRKRRGRVFAYSGSGDGVVALKLKLRRKGDARLTLKARRFLDGIDTSRALQLRIKLGNRCFVAPVSLR
jgi:hypothetical protein